MREGLSTTRTLPTPMPCPTLRPVASTFDFSFS
jgi:hypothetical protein